MSRSDRRGIVWPPVRRFALSPSRGLRPHPPPRFARGEGTNRNWSKCRHRFSPLAARGRAWALSFALKRRRPGRGGPRRNWSLRLFCRRHTRASPRPVIVWRRLRGGRSFTPGLRIAGGVRGFGSKRTCPVRLPAVMAAPRASAPMRYGRGFGAMRGGRPHDPASPAPPSLGVLGKHRRSRSVTSLVASGSNL